MNERSRTTLLSVILALACFFSAGAGITLLYRTALAQTRNRLAETVRSYARIVEAIAENERLEQQLGQGVPPGNEIRDAREATLAQVRAGHGAFEGLGSTGEFTLGRRDGDQIVFLLPHRHSDGTAPKPVPVLSPLAEPMRRALAGKSGIVVGPDYRGATVLAAHEPLPELGLGLVAKMDLAEIRAPFIEAGMVTVATAIVVILCGVLLFSRITGPMIGAMRESEERFRGTFEQAAVGIAHVDLDGRFLRLNQRFCDMIAHAREEMLSLTFQDITHADDLQADVAYVRQVLTGEIDTYTMEKRYIRKDGTQVWGELTVSLQRTGSGTPQYFIAVVSDITERKQAAERQALHARVLAILNRPNEWQNLLGDLLSAIKAFGEFDAVGIRLRDGDDYPYYVQNGFTDEFVRLESHLACQANGTIQRDAQGRPVLQCTCGLVLSGHVPADNPLFTPNGSFWSSDTRPLLELTPEQDPRHEPRNRCIHEGYLSVALIPLRAGDRIIGLLQLNDRRSDRFTQDLIRFFEDIGNSIGIAFARQESQRAVNEARMRLEMALRSSNVGLWDWDPRTGDVYFSPEWKAQIGYRDDELAGNYEEWENRLHPEDKEATIGALQAYFRGHAPVYEVEFRLRHKDGSYRWIFAKGEALRDEHGEPVRVLGCHLDVTERKQTELAVQVERDRAQRYLDIAGVMLVALDRDGVVSMINRKGCELLGYSEDEIVGKNWFDHFLEPVVRESILAVHETLLEGGGGAGQYHENTVLTRSGEERLIAWHNVSLRDADGNVIGHLSSGEDITERKQAEERLRQSEERFRSLFGNMSSGVAVYEPVDDGREFVFTDYNRAGERMDGISRDCVIGQRVTDVFPGIQAMGLLDIFRRVWKTGVAEYQAASQYRDVRISGWRENRVFRLPSGEVVAVFADVTARKQAEDALCESETKHRLLFEMSRDAIMTLAPPSWKFTAGNPATVEMFGVRDEADFTSRAPWEYSPPKQPDGRPSDRKAREMIATAMRKGSHFFGWTHRRLNGEDFPATVLLTRFELHGQTLLQATVRDISREAMLEAQLRQSQKIESVGRLAGGVAHDFNNLLMGIMNYVELCRDGVGADHPIREWLDEITHEAQRSANLTRQLLAFARKQTIAPRVLDLNEAIEGMLKMLRRLIGEDIDLAWQPQSSLWPVKLDPGQVDQVLANLCVNARDAIGGVGKVTIETTNSSLDAEYCAEHPEASLGRYVMLAVSDDGCGMDRETLAHVFEPFFTTKPVGEGTGLGLATIHGIAKQNGGFVNVYSEPGKGTTFRVYLPCFEGEEARQAGTAKTTERMGGSETILLAEDEKSIRLTTALFLEQLGYTVLTAEQPDEALRRAAEHPGAIHLLITDVVMPGMSGRDLAVRLAEQHPRMKCLFISGYTANVIAHRGILEADVEFLAKPFTRDDIARKVREVLDG